MKNIKKRGKNKKRKKTFFTSMLTCEMHHLTNGSSSRLGGASCREKKLEKERSPIRQVDHLLGDYLHFWYGGCSRRHNLLCQVCFW
jgi:hypothetical protein